MSASIAAQMLATARAVLADAPDERVRAQIERLAGHVEALNAFPLPADAPPYFPVPNPLPEAAISPAPPGNSVSAAKPSGPLHTLGAAEIAALVRSYKISVEEVARATLDRIAATEKHLQAWVWVDGEQVIAEAKRLDAMQGAAWPRGPLHGVPIGVKDIYDVAGMPTRAGSRVLADAPAAKADSWLVARLRAAGALIIGKTATTEFAASDPAGTRNPWNLAHTPGGSSSGSAAAVAARVVPLALGTQTAGSVIRPASFCGIVGFKPSWGRVPLDGVIPFAWSLDTAGWFARSVEDAVLVWRAIGGPLADRHTLPSADSGLVHIPEPFAVSAPRSYLNRETYDALQSWHASRPHPTPEVEANAAVEQFWLRFNSGTRPRRTPAVNLESASLTLDAQQVIMAAEAAEFHGLRYLRRAGDFGSRIGALVASGMAMPAQAYLRAQRARCWVRASTLQRVQETGCDTMLTASAPGSAPEGLGSTGDPSFNAPWTQFGFPAITLFGGTDTIGLPQGVQLVGRPGADGDLLGVAAWCENLLGRAPAPPASA